MEKVSVLVISLADPILVGVYKNELLIDSYSKEGKTSDVLPLIFEQILAKYNLKNLLYTNGPGSYMSIKISYIFLKTLCVVKGIDIYGADGFLFNQNTPIKALGKKYFFKDNDDKIIIDFINKDSIIQSFQLPNKIKMNQFEKDLLPSYNLPAVQ